jgi:hypothetical protein
MASPVSNRTPGRRKTNRCEFYAFENLGESSSSLLEAERHEICLVTPWEFLGTVRRPAFSGRKEGLPKTTLLIASCLWLAASTAPALAGDPGMGSPWRESPESLLFYGATMERQNAGIEETDPRFHLSLEHFDLSAFGASFSPPKNELNNELQGLAARYQMGLVDYGIEITGGYVPRVRLSGPGSAQSHQDAYLGYVNLRIPLHRFYIDGGAFYGQNMDLLNLIGRPSSEDREPDSELFGYQIAGGYQFNDSLSLRAGWGQTGQDRKMIRDDLQAWYVQAQINLGWQISLTPQMGFVDFMKGDGEKTREEAFYCGARWQINF